MAGASPLASSGRAVETWGRAVILAEWTYRIDYVTKGTADAQFLSVLLHPNYSKRVC